MKNHYQGSPLKKSITPQGIISIIGNEEPGGRLKCKPVNQTGALI
jgi:hypothetical protein